MRTSTSPTNVRLNTNGKKNEPIANLCFLDRIIRIIKLLQNLLPLPLPSFRTLQFRASAINRSIDRSKSALRLTKNLRSERKREILAKREREGSRYRSDCSSAPRVNGFKRRSQRLRARTHTHIYIHMNGGRCWFRSWADISCRPSSHPQGYRIFTRPRPPLLMTAETASKISRSVRERDPSACVRYAFFQMRRHRRHRRRQVINGGY